MMSYLTIYVVWKKNKKIKWPVNPHTHICTPLLVQVAQLAMCVFLPRSRQQCRCEPAPKKKKKKMWRTNLPDCIQHTHTQTHTRNDMKQWFKCVSTGRWRGPESQWSVAVPSLAFTISGECEYKWHLLSINHDHFGGANTPPQKKTWRKKALGDFRRAQKHVLNGQCQFRRKPTKNDAIFFFFPDGGTHTKCFKSVMRILQGISQKSALIYQRACAENAFSPVMGIQQEIKLPPNTSLIIIIQ